MKIVFASLFAITATTMVLATLARGPEGTAVAKETPERIAALAQACGLRLQGAVTIPPSGVPLSTRATLKHQVKAIARQLGVAYPAFDSAEEYSLIQPNGPALIHCSARFSGDHLIGLEIKFAPGQHSFADCLRNALAEEFQYEILSNYSHPEKTNPRTTTPIK